MTSTKIVRVKNISEYHRILGLPKPEHPLIGIVNFENVEPPPRDGSVSVIFDFYSIALKRVKGVRYKYGQQRHDFEAGGGMYFMAPNQIISFENIEHEIPEKPRGWMLLIHPDFIWKTSLAKTINQYDFWSYAVHEALFLSEKEETTINTIIQNIEQEHHSNIDKFSKKIIVSQIETLLSYAERFYHRQFITREKANHQILEKLENLLAEYFKNDDLFEKGLPTVQYIAAALNISPSYLTGLLKVLTGQNTQQHIHEKLIEKAKEKLSTTELSVSEIAYQLGFEHPQSFSKLFKTKTNLSPLEFRQTFN